MLPAGDMEHTWRQGPSVPGRTQIVGQGPYSPVGIGAPVALWPVRYGTCEIGLGSSIRGIFRAWGLSCLPGAIDKPQVRPEMEPEQEVGPGGNSGLRLTH